MASTLLTQVFYFHDVPVLPLIRVGTELDAVIAYVRSGTSVALHLSKFKTMLDNLSDECDAYGARNANFPMREEHIKVGVLCIAQYEDGNWYRCVILSVDYTKKVALLNFIDYGNSDYVDFSKMLPCDPKLVFVPPQAVAVRLEKGPEEECLRTEAEYEQLCTDVAQFKVLITECFITLENLDMHHDKDSYAAQLRLFVEESESESESELESESESENTDTKNVELVVENQGVQEQDVPDGLEEVQVKAEKEEEEVAVAVEIPAVVDELEELEDGEIVDDDEQMAQIPEEDKTANVKVETICPEENAVDEKMEVELGLESVVEEEEEIEEDEVVRKKSEPEIAVATPAVTTPAAPMTFSVSRSTQLEFAEVEGKAPAPGSGFDNQAWLELNNTVDILNNKILALEKVVDLQDGKLTRETRDLEGLNAKMMATVDVLETIRTEMTVEFSKLKANRGSEMDKTHEAMALMAQEFQGQTIALEEKISTIKGANLNAEKLCKTLMSSIEAKDELLSRVKEEGIQKQESLQETIDMLKLRVATLEVLQNKGKDKDEQDALGGWN